jgi:hypothetical protein
MDEKTARDMDRLLAGGELSGPEADAIEKRVFEALDRAAGRQRPGGVIRYWPVAASAALAMAAAVLLVVRGGMPGVEPSGGPMQPEEGALGPTIALRCADGTLAACPVTSSLVFTVSGNRKRVFLSAWAERVGTEGGSVVYFSQEGGGVEIAAAAEGAHAAETKMRLSPEHEPGPYRVHAFVADRVLGREEMRSGRGADAAQAEVRVQVAIIE